MPAEGGDGIVDLPIDGTLDLHAFRPEDVKDLLAAYLDECRNRGITQVRIIHGKGIGTLRETVHASLARMSGIASFLPAGEDAGGWGATIVIVEPPPAGAGGSPQQRDLPRRS